MAGCDSTGGEVEPPASEAPATETPVPDDVPTPPPEPPVVVTPVEPPPPPEEPRPPPPMFQPGFHQALRWSYSTGGVTFRLRVPVGRAGERVRLAFRAGDGSLVLRKATVALAGPNGSLASAPVAVTFSGTPGFSVAARTRVVSDPVPLPVQFRDELAVSFEVQGALGVSAIHALPGSYVRSGAYAGVTGPLGGTPWDRAVGLATVDVEGPPARAFVALGDSITEGYIDEQDDTRQAWPSVAQAQLGVPIVNAGVSGQGFYDALRNLDAEVLSLQGITDCIVLLGTNDLSALDMGGLKSRMNTLVSRLQPFCRLWVGTLLPKEKSNHGSYEVVKQQRLELNAWIRATFPDVIDFEAVTRQPGNVHLFLDGLEVDGIHPSVEGHRVMATEAARVLREAGVQPGPGVLRPAEGAP
ncbi:MAG TPA: GDSL-type esterase/lipase family protein [Archangium sp.]|uniref:SGNH/GDSL hydrolase family protein n=1 Tax=Archangium sp. TaxID=1872627 RepID=UPI002E3101C3|nr:GDSL-type esterase/lipase family protein [Archangium sp.]HEX5747297.1 GDSL-type esterase/lipase family protein [Archangium sp.]